MSPKISVYTGKFSGVMLFYTNTLHSLQH